ncbi:hypothetical protein FOA43_001237 [Brettanomyces nanus]|uniref:CHCH domain-containing protein n=1 Tax=Eeniella nana TaxID=13502 RepID=A0A875S1E3_EENNA|nr:uncharacterized protein FOA43_001237 [Brettanomyces nanus]QPG73922.1 hypothetical protein FOA43_001237 [Brettanomyces nanus]
MTAPSGFGSFGSRSAPKSTAVTSPSSAHQYHGPNYAGKPGQTTAGSRSPGLFGQMASTAAGVAVGSALGHTIGAGLTGLFGNRSESQDPDTMDQQSPATSGQAQDLTASQTFQSEAESRPCEMDAKNLARCLEDSNGDYHACDYYMQMLKSCKSAAKEFTAN